MVFMGAFLSCGAVCVSAARAEVQGPTLAEERRRADNRRVLATRLTLTLARGMFFVFASFGLLLGGGIILVAATVGVCAAGVAVLYGAAHLFADLFGFSLAWGLVTSCGLLFLGCAVGGMIHDIRLKAMPPQPAERQTTRATQPPSE